MNVSPPSSIAVARRNRRRPGPRLLRYWRYSQLGQVIGAFLFAAQMNLLLVAAPLLVIELGGEQLAVGAVGGLWFGIYVLALLGIGPHADRIGVKRLVLTAASLSIGTTLLLMASTSVAMVLVAVSLAGALASMFWSPLSGWLSSGYEGPRLQRRLSCHNLGWSSGAVIGSLLARQLVAVSFHAVFLAMIAILLATIVALAGVRRRRTCAKTRPAGRQALAEPPADDQARLLKAYRSVARIALFFTCIAAGATASPLASLVTSLALDPSVFALGVALRSVAIMAVSLALAKMIIWRYNFPLLIAVQLAVVAGGVILSLAADSLTIYLGVILIMGGYTVVYFSHMFYGVSKSARRTASMAVHELVVSIGLAIGSMLIGGVLGQTVNEAFTYQAAAACVAAGILIQIPVFRRLRRP
mgnify:CR=1 FL=1